MPRAVRYPDEAQPVNSTHGDDEDSESCGQNVKLLLFRDRRHISSSPSPAPPAGRATPPLPRTSVSTA